MVRRVGLAGVLGVSLFSGCGADAHGAAVATTSETSADDDGGTSETTTGADVDPEVPPLRWPHLECDPLVPSYCGFPFPSNVFTVADETTETGRRVALLPHTVPETTRGTRPDPAPWDRSDGFSAGHALVVHLPGATVDGLATPASIDTSLSPASKTVVIDAETGSRVPHFSELDMTAEDKALRSLMIRPVVRLDDATRYIVAIRGVVDMGGDPLPASEAFAALRDETEHPDPSVDARRELYADIFARLDTQGVPRSDLQLAWDFTTASTANNTGAMLAMRDRALALVGDDGPAYTITAIEPDPSPDAILEITGMMRVPLFLDQPGPGANLLRGPDGVPIVNPRTPWADFGFTVWIPPRAVDGPLPVAQFGHGLFGTMHEPAYFELPFANRYGYVLCATDWIGMADTDDWLHLGEILLSGELHRFSTVMDRLHQGVLNQLVLTALMRGGFVDDPAIVFPGGVDGEHSAIDPTRRYYYGSSQGGIMGATFMALSTDVERGMLDTAGQPYSLLLSRSIDFDDFFTLAQSNYPDPRDIVFAIALVQMLWDRVEPSGYTPFIRQPLPGTIPHEVLIRPAVGDHQVTTLGAHIMARSAGAVHLDTGVREVWGLDPVPGPHVGSALVEYGFGLPPEPLENIPSQACDDPHDVLRTLEAGQQQLDHFFRTGEIANFCGGACRFPQLGGCR